MPINYTFTDTKLNTMVYCATYFSTRTQRTVLLKELGTYIVADPNQQSTAASRSFPVKRFLAGKWDFFDASGPWGEDPSFVSMCTHALNK